MTETIASHSRTPRWWFLNGGLLVAGLVFAWLAINGGTYTEVLTGDEVQRMTIAGITKWENTPPPKKVHFQDVQISFDAGLVNFDATVTTEYHSHLFIANVHASGSPEYRAGAFYFHPTGVSFSHITFEKPTSSSPVMERLKGAVAGKVHDYVVQHGLQEVSAAVKAEFNEWVQKQGMTMVEAALNNYPIYTLKSTNRIGFVARMALEKVEVVDGTLHVTISALQFGLTIIITIICIIGGIVLFIGMAMNPELGLLLGLLS